MGFDSPWGLLVLAAILPVIWLLRQSELRTRAVMNVFKSKAPPYWYFRTRSIFLSFYIGALAVVVAGPYLDQRVSGDYLFLIDTSRSMQARNTCVEPTFFIRAKTVMREVLEGIPEGRFGIVAFDRMAFPVTQLTFDKAYLNEVIDKNLSMGMAYQATSTDLANALSVLVQKKQSLPAIFGNVEYVILLTDGHIISDSWQENITRILMELQAVNIKIIAVGIGNPVETPVPIVSSSGECREQFIRVNGEVIRIPLRADILKLVAGETQGKYFGEAQTAELVTFIREMTLTDKVPEQLQTGQLQRNDISWAFLLAATLALFGYLAIRSGSSAN